MESSEKSLSKPSWLHRPSADGGLASRSCGCRWGCGVRMCLVPSPRLLQQRTQDLNLHRLGHEGVPEHNNSTHATAERRGVSIDTSSRDQTATAGHAQPQSDETHMPDSKHMVRY